MKPLDLLTVIGGALFVMSVLGGIAENTGPGRRFIDAFGRRLGL